MRDCLNSVIIINGLVGFFQSCNWGGEGPPSRAVRSCVTLQTDDRTAGIATAYIAFI